MFEKDLRKLVDQNWRAHKSRRELTWNNLATSHERRMRDETSLRSVKTVNTMIFTQEKGFNIRKRQ